MRIQCSILMSYRGFVMLVAGLCGSIGGVYGQTQTCEPALGADSINFTCAQGSAVYLDLSSGLAELASAFSGTNLDFTYDIALTSGGIPPGLILSSSGVLSGTLT